MNFERGCKYFGTVKTKESMFALEEWFEQYKLPYLWYFDENHFHCYFECDIGIGSCESTPLLNDDVSFALVHNLDCVYDYICLFTDVQTIYHGSLLTYFCVYLHDFLEHE